MVEKLFKFPIIMVDGHKEEKREDMSRLLGAEPEEEEVEVIYGEAECPYYDFISISDRWLPNDDSYEKALNGKFDACFVQFDRSGSYIVPWPKERFKKEIAKFTERFSSAERLTDILADKLKD